MTLGVSAGDRATADQYNALVPKFLRQASDQSVTSSTSVVNHNTFASIAFDAGQVWECEVTLDVDGANAGDLKLQWAVTGGATTDRRHILGMGVSGTTPNDTTGSFQARTTTSAVSLGTDPEGAGVRGTVQEKFLLTTTTAGTLTLQWAQASSDGTATTIRAGSWFVARRLS